MFRYVLFFLWKHGLSGSKRKWASIENSYWTIGISAGIQKAECLDPNSTPASLISSFLTSLLSQATNCGRWAVCVECSSALWLLQKGVGVVLSSVSKFCHLVIADVVIAEPGVIALKELGPWKGLRSLCLFFFHWLALCCTLYCI